MTIAAGAILVGGTTSSTGGVSTTFIPKGDTLNEMKVVLDDSSEFIDSTIITFTVRDPSVNAGAPNGYNQGRSSIKAVVPLALDNSGRTTNTINVSMSVDPETTDAEKDALIELGVQLVRGAAFDAFWKKQSLA